MTATKEQQKRLNIESLILQHGAHKNPDQGMCVMEAVAFMAGEKFSDHPECACPVMAGLLRAWNDRLSTDRRQELKRYIIPLVGSKSTPAVENKRRWMAVDWAVRTAVPFTLREANLVDHAKKLEALPEIVNWETRDRAWPVLRAAEEAAREARRKSWDKWYALTPKQKAAAAEAAVAVAAAAVAVAEAEAAVAEVAEVAAAAVAVAEAEAAVAAVAEAAAAAVAVAAAAEAEAVAAEAAAAEAAAAAVAAAKKKAEQIRAGLTASAHDLVERMLAVKE